MLFKMDWGFREQAANYHSELRLALCNWLRFWLRFNYGIEKSIIARQRRCGEYSRVMILVDLLTERIPTW
jgi:hypothetical protein